MFGKIVTLIGAAVIIYGAVTGFAAIACAIFFTVWEAITCRSL